MPKKIPEFPNIQTADIRWHEWLWSCSMALPQADPVRQGWWPQAPRALLQCGLPFNSCFAHVFA